MDQKILLFRRNETFMMMDQQGIDRKALSADHIIT